MFSCRNGTALPDKIKLSIDKPLIHVAVGIDPAIAHKLLSPTVDRLHPEWGKQYFGGIIEQYWDLQNQHASHVFTADRAGNDLTPDIGFGTQYDNVSLYQTPGGLMKLMR